MLNYIIRRLILLPITLFCIVFINFLVMNLAPGEPTTITEINPQGEATRREGHSVAFGSDNRYLQFREFYGLTLPILFNPWPSIKLKKVQNDLWQLVNRKKESQETEEMSLKDYDSLRITFGDQARYLMPKLLKIIDDPSTEVSIRWMAVRFFIRGGTRQAYLGPSLDTEQKAFNKKINKENNFLSSLIISADDSPEVANQKIKKLHNWYETNQNFYNFNPTFAQKIAIFFFDTRFYKYISRVISLDFGTLRNDSNKTVINEVVKRFKYSLTLAILPMLITFILCQIFGFLMAYKHNRWPDYTCNLFFLVLYAIPIFVVAPFLIEKIALNHTFPFTNIPIPISGFTSPDSIYDHETSLQRLFDMIQHICLPLVAIIYGSVAAQARLSRTAVLEVLRQDYVRTAWAKGVPPISILFKHVGRNAAITIVTSIAGSLGVVLGGSLIVETLFGINGFGKFFYDAIINRDYNVIMFSALAGSFLSLVGFLVADLAYTLLDPRLTLE
jgi:peptide/nickel transport system permease protein